MINGLYGSMRELQAINYAYNKNSMFDGEGNITYLKKYWEEMWDEEYVDEFGTLDKRRLGYVIESLQRAFAGEDVEFDLLETERGLQAKNVTKVKR